MQTQVKHKINHENEVSELHLPVREIKLQLEILKALRREQESFIPLMVLKIKRQNEMYSMCAFFNCVLLICIVHLIKRTNKFRLKICSNPNSLIYCIF